MSVFFASRKGAIAFALLFSMFGSIAHAAVYAPDAPSDGLQGASAGPSAEPFSLSTSLLPDGPLRTKWQDVARTIESESHVIADCRTSPETCASPAARRFLSIVRAASARSGLARLGEINRAINLAIRPVSDLAQYGVEDHWSSPLATLAAGAGDCEDYAIAKLVALREAGIAGDDLRLIIMRETTTGDDHAVLTARFEGHWRLLDNRTFMMLEDAEPSKYRPLFAIDTEGVKRFGQAPIETAQAKQNAATASPATTDGATAVSTDVEPIGFDDLSRALVL